jgi:drug/metabolite transporter (DMT)-like permease
MGVVAPLAALGVIVPVIIGLLSGRLPSVVALVGIVVAITGVVVTARGSTSSARSPNHGRSIVLALGSAVGFGLLQYAISGGSQYSTVMTMVVMRATSVPVLAVVASIALRQGGRSDETEGARNGLPVRLLILIGVIGLFDVSANLLFAFATVAGELAIVAVLGSLYPAVTVLLAKIIDHERMSRGQNFGVGVALAGVAMIALGS